LNISLKIKCKNINNSIVNKTTTFGYCVKKIDGIDCVKNILKFDLKYKGPMTYWVMREYTSVTNFIY
jgi:hypothetical protein